jgi:hypothetical protein
VWKACREAVRGVMTIAGTTGLLTLRATVLPMQEETGNFERSVESEFTEQMFSGRVVATRHWPRNLARAHLSSSRHGSSQ